MPSGPPIFPEDHLACYDIDPMPADEFRMVEDRVAASPVDLIESEMLCVPSTKTVIEPTPSLAPWGIASLGLLMLSTVFWVARQRERYGEVA